MKDIRQHTTVAAHMHNGVEATVTAAYTPRDFYRRIPTVSFIDSTY